MSLDPDTYDAATTLRWYINHRWGDPADHAAVVELIDRIVGHPPPQVAPAPVRIETDEPGIPAPSPDPTMDDLAVHVAPLPRVALVVGHNSRAPGAWADAPLSVSEYVYHNDVVDEILETRDLPFEARRFLRRPSTGYTREIQRVYAEVDRWNADLAVELHFNGGGGDYLTMLYAAGSAEGEKAARAIGGVFSRALGIADQGPWSRDRGDRGGYSVWAGAAPCVLTEPFFGDHPRHVEIVADHGVDEIASIYVAAIAAALRALDLLPPSTDSA